MDPMFYVTKVPLWPSGFQRPPRSIAFISRSSFAKMCCSWPRFFQIQVPGEMSDGLVLIKGAPWLVGLFVGDEIRAPVDIYIYMDYFISHANRIPMNQRGFLWNVTNVLIDVHLRYFHKIHL